MDEFWSTLSCDIQICEICTRFPLRTNNLHSQFSAVMSMGNCANASMVELRCTCRCRCRLAYQYTCCMLKASTFDVRRLGTRHTNGIRALPVHRKDRSYVSILVERSDLWSTSNALFTISLDPMVLEEGTYVSFHFATSV